MIARKLGEGGAEIGPTPTRTRQRCSGVARGEVAGMLGAGSEKNRQKELFPRGHSLLLSLVCPGGRRQLLFSHTKAETREAAALLGITHQGWLADGKHLGSPWPRAFPQERCTSPPSVGSPRQVELPSNRELLRLSIGTRFFFFAIQRGYAVCQPAAIAAANSVSPAQMTR